VSWYRSIHAAVYGRAQSGLLCSRRRPLTHPSLARLPLTLSPLSPLSGVMPGDLDPLTSCHYLTTLKHAYLKLR